MSTTPDRVPPDDAEVAPASRWSLPVLLLVVVVLTVAVVAAYVVGRGGQPRPAGGSAGSGGATGTGSGVTPVVATPACRPGPDHPAPTIDLGVQPGRGGDELLSQRAVDRLVRLAQDAGAGVISTAASWRYLQPQPSTAPADFRFAGLDRVLRSASRAGLQVRLQLIGIPRWAADDPEAWTERTPPTSPAELDRWAEFVSVVARHVDGRVDYLEVWNEPNREAYWPGGPDAAAFARLLARTYQPVKASAPDVQVVSGGLIDNDTGYLEVLYQAISDLGISPRPFDLVGVRPFSGAASPTTEDPARRFTRQPYGAVDQNFTGFRALHQVMQERGDGDTDLYLGAFGYSTRANRGQPGVPDATRAEHAVEALEIVTCTDYVRAFSWYYLHPTPFDPVSWTLLDRGLRPTRTYEAFVTWAQQAAAASPTTP